MTDPWGIDDRYFGALGTETVTTRATRAATLGALRAPPEPAGLPETADATEHQHGGHGHGQGARRPGVPAIDDDVHGRVKVVRAGESPFIAAPGRLTLEDGTVIGVERALPPDLPIGYHYLEPRTGQGHATQTLVIATPGSCHLPDDLRTWGWAAQMYA